MNIYGIVHKRVSLVCYALHTCTYILYKIIYSVCMCVVVLYIMLCLVCAGVTVPPPPACSEEELSREREKLYQAVGYSDTASAASYPKEVTLRHSS